MSKDIIISLNKDFESIKKIDENGVEYWEARELMNLLGYKRWENAEEVIAKAAKASINSGQAVDNHFRLFTKMVPSAFYGWRQSEADNQGYWWNNAREFIAREAY